MCRNFSPFAAVSLFGVAALAETFPSVSVSGPFLLDVPGFQVPSDSRGDWGPLGHFLDFVKYLDSDKQYAYITYHN